MFMDVLIVEGCFIIFVMATRTEILMILKKDKFLKKSTHNMDEEKYLQWVEESESKQEEDVPPRNDDALGLEMES